MIVCMANERSLPSHGAAHLVFGSATAVELFLKKARVTVPLLDRLLSAGRIGLAADRARVAKGVATRHVRGLRRVGGYKDYSGTS